MKVGDSSLKARRKLGQSCEIFKTTEIRLPNGRLGGMIWIN